MGIEPMSENPLTQPSPWAVCYLEFPISGANKHAPRQGSPFLHDRFKSEQPMHVHRSNDAQSPVAVLRGGTGDPQVTAPPIGIPKGCQLGSHSNSIVVVYFLSLSSLRDYSARHAYHASESPSRPLHPRGSLLRNYYSR